MSSRPTIRERDIAVSTGGAGGGGRLK
jgi:hypothetical protein